MEETITFEFIRKIQREEQRSPKLTKLPENFFPAVSAYLQQKRKLEKDERIGMLEMKNIERLIADIFDRRERKILNSALIAARTNIPPENINAEERMFFDRILASIKERREENMKKMESEESVEFESLIIFKEDTPSFVATDLKNYGPFKKGDIARLPEDNMKLLIEKGIAEGFKVSK